MRVAAVISDLMLFSRIDAAARSCGASLIRVDEPRALPPAGSLDLALVDWSARSETWASDLREWRAGGAPRVVLFGRHTDLEAHAAARAAGLGAMWARSKIVAELSNLMRGSAAG